MDLSRRVFLGSGATLTAALADTTGANDRIRIGVAGSGARAQELIEDLVVLPGVEVVGVVDAYRGRVERSISRSRAKARDYKHYRALLDDQSIDAIVVASPDHWHKPMVLDSLSAGKDVFCEKPLTFRASEGMEIVAAARKAQRIMQVGSHGVSSPIQQKAREIVQSGRLGKITIIRATYNRNTAGGAWIYPIPPDASRETVDWEMFLGPAPRHDFDLARFFRWRCYQDYSGGISTDLFVHLCTTIHFVMDAKAPASVMAMGELYRWKESRDLPDTLNAVMEYPEGFVVNMSSTFNNQYAASGTIQILGTEGSLLLAGDNLTFYPETAADDNRWVVASWPRALETAYYRDPKVRQAEMPYTRPPNVLDGVTQFRQEGPDARTLHIGNWIASLRTRKPHWEDALAGHRAAACAHMINQSVQQRRLVEWDFAREDIRSA